MSKDSPSLLRKETPRNDKTKGDQDGLTGRVSMKGLYTNTQLKLKTKLRGLSPHANYTDRAAAAGRRS